MNRECVADRGRAAGVVVALAVIAATGATPVSLAETVKVPHGYHWQQTNFFCGPGSMQMMLDTPAVRNNNPNVATLLNRPPPAGSGLTQDQWVQLQLYGASRPRRVLPIAGTDPVAFSLTMNAYDGIPNGPALPANIPQGGNPNHAYAWYGFVPNIAGGDRASRTVAAALKEYDIPATVAVNHGAHWIVVDGVSTQGNIALNGNYRITGFRVSDPWTGYAIRNPAPGRSRGLGVNAWYRYGFNANGRQGAWFNFFNPLNPMPTPFGGQYVIEVEPDVPIQPDDGSFSSFPDPAPLLPMALTANTVVPYLMDVLAGPDEYLSEYFDDGGSFAESLVSFLSFPGEVDGNGDWIVPFDGPAAGNDDLLGAVTVDALTGAINQAMWLNDGDDPWTFDVLDGYYDDLYTLNLPANDATVPGMGTALVVGVGCLRGLRRRRDVGRA